MANKPKSFKPFDEKNILPPQKNKYPIVISIVTFLVAASFSIYKIIQIKNNDCNPYDAAGLGCIDKSLDELSVLIIISIATTIILITWLVYCISLSAEKKKKKDKNWFIPLFIIIGIILLLILTILAIIFFHFIAT